MGIPFIQQYRIGKYLLEQKIKGNKRYPLVLMLEPLFRCNLACDGCGKIQYPNDILNKNLSAQECFDAVDECGAPVVSIPGGEPLLHPEIKEIVEGIIERKKFVYLCTNAIQLKKKMGLFKPSPYLTFSVHLDGLEEHHDRAVCKEGIFKIAVEAIQIALERGYRVTCNTTLFSNQPPQDVAEFFDYVMDLGVEGITVSPGYSYEKAPNQDKFLRREQTKQYFRDIFSHQKDKKWKFNQSPLFLDFLVGKEDYDCTPWGNPTRNVFGWQKPCYLLVNEGYVQSFKELMEETQWDQYGHRVNVKCQDCMVHCGFEPTAVEDTLKSPFKMVRSFLSTV